jgi:hypothetical protein
MIGIKDLQSKEIKFAELGYFLFEDIKGLYLY